MSIYSKLRDYWQVGIAVAIACASVLLSRETLWREFMRGIVPALTVVLVLLTTLVAFVLYLSATQDELDMAEEYKYVEQVGALRWGDFAIVFILALSFGTLIAFVANLLVYTLVLTILQTADSFGTSIVQTRFFQAYLQTPKLPSALYDYYLVKPHFVLRTARLMGYSVALILAVIARFRPAANVTELAWLVVVVTTASSEYTIHRWRSERQRGLSLLREKQISAQSTPQY